MESMFEEELARAAEADDPQVLLWNLFESCGPPSLEA